MIQKIIFIAIFVVLSLTASAFAGPYPVTFLVEGVTGEQQSALTEIFGKRNIDARYLQTGDGTIQFYAGAHSAESLLKLSDVSAALKEINLVLRPETWILREQTIGVLLSAAVGEENLDEAIESFADVGIQVLGTVSMDGQTCKVLQLSGPVDYASFTAHLEKANIKINDLVWGHWEYGWGVEGAHHDRAQSFGAMGGKQ
jgi:hypothetical protein